MPPYPTHYIRVFGDLPEDLARPRGHASTQAGGSADNSAQSKQYLGADDGAGRVSSDQTDPGRAAGPLGGNDDVQGDPAGPPAAHTRKRGTRRRKKIKH